MKAKELKDLLNSLSDDESLWFWITTKEEMDKRVEWVHTGEAPLTKEEYESFIRLLEVDDGLVQECFGSEDYVLKKIIGRRKPTTEGKNENGTVSHLGEHR